MFGFVNPVDEAGNPVAKSGVAVTLEGVTPAVTATSDANGRFEFVGVRNGTYNVAYNRADLGLFRRISVAHVGGDQPTFLFTSTLSQPSTTRVTITGITPSPSANSVTVGITLMNNVIPAGSLSRYVVFVGTNPNVTAANGFQISNVAVTANAPTVNSTFTMTRASLNALGFATGTPVYAAVYGTSSSQAGYTDANTGRAVYTTLSPLPAVTSVITVP